VAGEAIPIGARILSVVDCFDALTSDRPYRSALSTEEAFAILTERRGSMYDPTVVDLFMALQPRLNIGSGHDSSPEIAAVELPRQAQVVEPAPAQSTSVDTLVAMIVELLPDCLCVAYCRSAGEQVTARAVAGPGAACLLGHSMPLGHGVSGWVAANAFTVDDTDAMLDLAGVASLPGEWAGWSCSSLPIRLPAATIVITVYGPRAGAAARLRTTRTIAHLVEQMLSQTLPAMAMAS
jgi:hypothetical protein